MSSFFKQYILHPRSVGAIAPSSRNLAVHMMDPIDFNRAECIVEYGPGTGSFTEEIIRRKKPDTLFLMIEKNREFARELKARYQGDSFAAQNIHVIYGGAENASRYLAGLGRKHADYVISGLPFTSLPKDLSTQVFLETQKILGDRGAFITFQYTLVKLPFFLEYFNLQACPHILKNLPPAYVMVLQNKPSIAIQ